MGIRLIQSDTVVVGNFNPHIVSPPWLAKQEITTEKPEPTQFNFVGHTVVFRFKIGDFVWSVDENRLVILSDGDRDATSLVTKVVEKLPHTPFVACGHNFRFASSRSEWNGSLPILGNVDLDSLHRFGEPRVVVWHMELAQPNGATVNSDLIESSDSVTISFNFHRATNTLEKVISAANLFSADLGNSRALLSSLYGAEGQ